MGAVLMWGLDFVILIAVIGLAGYLIERYISWNL